MRLKLVVIEKEWKYKRDIVRSRPNFDDNNNMMSWITNDARERESGDKNKTNKQLEMTKQLWKTLIVWTNTHSRTKQSEETPAVIPRFFSLDIKHSYLIKLLPHGYLR